MFEDDGAVMEVEDDLPVVTTPWDRELSPVGPTTVHDVSAALDEVAALQERIHALEGEKLLAVERARRVAVRCEPDLLAGEEVAVLRAGTSRRHELARRAFVADLATTVRIPEHRADRLLDAAQTLTRSGTAMLGELRRGRTSAEHATALAEVLADLPDPQARSAVQAAVLPRAATTTLPQFRSCLRRARDRAHPEPFTSRHRKAAEKRAVYLDPGADGMAWLSAYLPAPCAHAAYDRLTTAGRTAREAGDRRSLVQLRADSLSALLLAGADGPPLDFRGDARAGAAPHTDAAPPHAAAAPHSAAPHTDTAPHSAAPHSAAPHSAAPHTDTAPHSGAAPHADAVPHTDAASHAAGAGLAAELASGVVPDLADHVRRITPRVQVTVPVLALLDRTDDPAELAGHGPVDPKVAAVLAGAAPSLRRLLVDPGSGRVLSTDPGTYTVPSALRAFLQARDGVCRFPGCTRPAAGCDVDHTVAWADGGRTVAGNLAHLCRRHHVIKHQTGWSTRQDSDGSLVWTSPTGRVSRDPVADPVDLTGTSAHLGPGDRDVATWDGPPPF